MKKSVDRVWWLENEIKEKEKLLNRYKSALKSSNERLKNIVEELDSGFFSIRKIHEKFIPLDLPKLPHFRFSYRIQPAARGVSGDFFDIIPLKDPMKFGILLSSCSSYALAALLMSSLLKSPSPLEEQQTAEDFLKYLSDKVFLSLPKSEEIHVFYGIVNRRDFTLNYSAAGSFFAGVKSRNGFLTELSSSSHTVHKENKSLFVSHTKALYPGDILVICSPGVLERSNSEGEVFGKSSISSILTQRGDSDVLELRQNILFQVEKFADNMPSHKDQTVLALEVKSRILKLAEKSDAVA